jgi:serine/threonine protein kinase
MGLVWTTHRWFPWLVVSGVQLPLALLWSLLAWTTPATRHRTVTRTLANPASPPPGPGAKAPPAPAAPDRGLRQGAPVPAIPHFELHREIGRGGYGQVWLARDAVGLWRALKLVRRESFADARPYEREFAGIRRYTPISLEHPGLVRVLHVGRADDDAYFYYVMELADPAEAVWPAPTADPTRPPGLTSPPSTPAPPAPGYSPRSLASVLQARGRLPATEVIPIAAQLADALEFLHRHQLIHRDVKPANILFVGGRPKLADLGLVTAMTRGDGEVSYLGTEGYIPPEGPGTAAADVYGLGKLVYVAATGRRPTSFPEFPTDLDGRTDQAVLLRLSEVWCRACEPDPARRPASAAALAADLRRLLPPADEASVPGPAFTADPPAV